MQSIDYHSEFSPDSWSMNALTTGTDDLIFNNVASIISPAGISSSAGTYSNISFNYIQGAITTSGVYFQTGPQSISVVENSSKSFTLDLSCSFSASTSITYRIQAFETGNRILGKNYIR